MVVVAEGFSPTAGRQRAKALGYIYKGRLRRLIPELIIKHHKPLAIHAKPAQAGYPTLLVFARRAKTSNIKHSIPCCRRL